MIHRFHVRNYKSIVDVDVELSPVTVLVGKSGTGKSNFVQALRFLRDLLISNQSLHQNWEEIRTVTASSELKSFSVEFSVAGIDEHFRYELTINKRGYVHHLDTEALFIGDKCLFHQHESESGRTDWIVEPDVVPIPNTGQIALGRIPVISEIVIAYTALTNGIGCYGFSDSVLCHPADVHTDSSGLADDAANFLSVIKDIATNLQDLRVRKNITSSLQYMNHLVTSVELNDIRQPNRIVVGHRADGKIYSLDLSQESGGFRRFYAHLLALYQRPPQANLDF